MKIIYIANIRIPTEKAHGIQIMKMCEAFAKRGAEVELIVPKRRNSISDDPFSYYGVQKNFIVTFLRSPDLVRFGKIGFYAGWIFFAIASLAHSLKKKADIYYFRDELSLFLISFFKKTAIEVHDIPESFLRAYFFILRRADYVISTNQWKKDELIKKGIHTQKIAVCPNGIDPKDFDIQENKKTLRENAGLPSDKKLVLYVGHLYDWKGADILAEASALLSGDTQVVFVGGADHEISDFKKRHVGKNFLIIPQKLHSEIARYMKLADALVLPNIPVNDESKYGTSPIKMFEYMASGVPIIASNLPSICEILNEKNALLTSPGNPQELANGIAKVLEDNLFAKNISEQALRDVAKYSWEKRAEKILSFVLLKK